MHNATITYWAGDTAVIQFDDESSTRWFEASDLHCFEGLESVLVDFEAMLTSHWEYDGDARAWVNRLDVASDSVLRD